MNLPQLGFFFFGTDQIKTNNWIKHMIEKPKEKVERQKGRSEGNADLSSI